MQKKTTDRSLLWRLAAFVLALILLPAALSISYILTTLSDSLRRSAEENADFYAAQLVEKNSSAMDLLRGSVESLIGDREVRAIMAQADEPLTGTQRVTLQNTLDAATLYSAAWTDKYIDSLYLFRGEDTVISSTRGGLLPSELSQITRVHERYRDFSSFSELVKPESDGAAYYILDYTDISTMSVCGKIIIKVNPDSMIPAESIQTIYPGTDVVFSNASGAMLSAKSHNEPEALEEALSRFNRMYHRDKNGYVDWRGQKYYHIRLQPDRYRLLLDIFIPEREILAASRTTVTWYLVFLAAVAALTLCGAIVLGRRLMKPVQRSIGTIEHMADGDLTVRMQPTGYTELNTLVTAFNRMADNLEQLYDDAYSKGLLLRESEYKLLEAQINPHFIFNVLETVNMRCLEAGQKETSRMVTDLAALLRANIARDDRQKVPLREELEYVRYYLNIQQARFQNELSYTISYADDALLDCCVPKFTLQPLVENSVVHGLERKPGGGTVDVQIWEEDDSVYIRIADDGVGFSSEMLDMAGNGQRHNHVALQNIRRRLGLTYGGAGALHLNSTPGVGTVALVIVPADDKGE